MANYVSLKKSLCNLLATFYWLPTNKRPTDHYTMYCDCLYCHLAHYQPKLNVGQHFQWTQLTNQENGLLMSADYQPNGAVLLCFHDASNYVTTKYFSTFRHTSPIKMFVQCHTHVDIYVVLKCLCNQWEGMLHDQSVAYLRAMVLVRWAWWVCSADFTAGDWSSKVGRDSVHRETIQDDLNTICICA